jgi:hypothetical protein
MIARIWHGKTNASVADTYLEYLFKSGLPAYRATPGNKGAWVLRRLEGDVAHFITLSFLGVARRHCGFCRSRYRSRQVLSKDALSC